MATYITDLEGTFINTDVCVVTKCEEEWLTANNFPNGDELAAILSGYQQRNENPPFQGWRVNVEVFANNGEFEISEETK